MKLTTKLFLLFVSFVTFWVCIIYFIMPNFLLKEFHKLEDRRMDWEVTRAIELMDNLIHQSELILLDWSKWDDAYEFVLSPDIDFLQTNLPNNFYEDQEINIVLIYDQFLNLTFSRAYDFNEGYDYKLPQQLIDDMKNNKNTSALYTFDDKVYAFSSRTITNSNESEEPKGLFIFMFEITEDHLLEISQKIGSELVITDYNGPSYDSISSEIESSKDTSQGRIYIPYTNVDESMTLAFEVAHEISQLGVENTYRVILIFILVFVLFTIIVYIWTRRAVKKLEIIILDVDFITQHNDLSRRIKIKTSGELTILKNGINKMLERISDTQSKLTQYATRDPLTGLLNRRVAFTKLTNYMKESIENDFPLTIAFIDLNDLKKVNDQMGHNIGDDYIKHIVNIIQSKTRNTDILCRVGGDEFLLIFPLCEVKHAEETMTRIDDEIAFFNHKLDYHMSISYGILPYDYQMELTQYIEAADAKMYLHKQTLKNKQK